MSFQRFFELCNDSLAIEWWKMLIMGMFFLLADIIIFIAMWYVRRSIAIEVGYPKRNKTYIKRKLQDYSVLEQLLLIKITAEADKKSLMLIINLCCHFLNLIAVISCIIGFVGSMITLAEGWAILLLIGSEVGMLFFTLLIEFIPHLIWVPSERKRYF